MSRLKDRTEFGHPAIAFLVTFVQGRLQRVRSGELDRGASAVEWVIISAVVVAIVGVVAAIINSALSEGANKVGNCIKGASASKTC
jgi:predicted PurR-regulated permease PerM